MKIYEVGGHIRDELLGLKSKDLDYTVIADSYEDMKSGLIERGYEIFLETPEYFTIKARGPKGACDFVWARLEGPYSDGRHPDWVKPGTLYDDIARRDFRMNSLARGEDGMILDYFGGLYDIENRVIRCVGDPSKRFVEDRLRIVRALRFSITKDMMLHESLIPYIQGADLSGLSVERIYEELQKMFKHDTFKTFETLENYQNIKKWCFMEYGIKLEPTLKGVK